MKNNNYEIYYTDSSRNTNIELLLFEYKDEEFEDKCQISENPIFKLYEATLKIGENKSPVYILEFSVLDSSNLDKILKSLINSKHFLNENYEFNYFFLKRIGYYINQINKSFNLVYLNNGNQHIGLAYLHEGKDSEVKIMMYFYKFLEFVSKCHEKSLVLAFLHPNLIFSSRITGFQVIDYSFKEILSDIEFENLYPNSCYFGYFDLTMTNRKDIKFKKSLDIILLSLLLAYLFSFDGKGKEKKNLYGMLVKSLQYDFHTNDKEFTSFLSHVLNKDIKKLLVQVLNLNYYNIMPIERFMELFKTTKQKYLVRIKCDDVKCRSPSAEKLNFLCEHFLCIPCYKKHIYCDNSSHYKLIRDNDNQNKSDVNSELENVFRMKNLIPELSRKNFFSYYMSLVHQRLKKIDYEHQRINNYSKLIDDKLNSMINYTEKLLSLKHYNLAEKVTRLRKDVDIELNNIIESIQKIDGKSSFKSKIQLTLNKTLNKRNSGTRCLLIDNPTSIDMLKTDMTQANNYDEFHSRYTDFSEMLWLLCNLAQDTKTCKTYLNYNLHNHVSFEILSNKCTEYYQNLTKHYINDLKKITNNFSDALVQYQNTLNLNETIGRNLLDFYPYTLNTIVSTLDIKNNEIIMYNTVEKTCTLEKVHFFDNYYPEPANMLKKCGWLNMVNKLIVTGGIYKNKKGMDVISKRSYYINFTPSTVEHFPRTSNSQQKIVSEPIHQAIKVKDMNFERIYHALVKVNEYNILAISGLNTQTCEMYNLLKDEWSPLPSLESPLFNSSAVVYNQIDVYIFFGLHGTIELPTYSEEILRYRMWTNQEEKWKVIDYKFYDKINLCLHSLISKNDKIYILGGKLSGENQYSNLVLEFNIKSFNIDISKISLSKKLCFLEPGFVKLHNDDYGLYSANNYFILMKI